ncbi:MAG: DEAD/DEAH box helicase family protein [Limisphaerales bacterium]
MPTFLELFGKLSPDEHRRGREFERVCKWFLEHDPKYRGQLRRVWLWDEWPGNWGRDKGIDLVAESFEDELWAVQCKAYAQIHSVTKQDVDSFLSESSRKCISFRLLIASAAEIGHNAREAIHGQEKPVGCLLLADLKHRPLNWPASPDHLLAPQPKPNQPRPDQQRAIADVVRKFKSHDRGQLIRACGTGKTLIGLRVAEAMKSQRTLVLVPSLSLVSQLVDDWTRDTVRPFHFLPVCSDETIGGEDHLVAEVSQLGFPATTDPATVATFLSEPGARVVFATYHSTPIVAQAFRRHRLPPLDLVIADEAHRCAGAGIGPFATVLDDRQIPARKRLFMTATPRIATEATKSRADSLGLELVSMDDPAVFGPVFHELKFSEAIRLNLLTDYRVEIVGVDDPLCRQYAEEGQFVTVDGETVTDARTLASHIALAKAIRKHDLRRIITFHGRVSRAREFADRFPQFLRWLPAADRPAGQLWTEMISGAMPASRRDTILDRLREVGPGERGLVTNARCLSEGIDIRALDGVAFIDPRESQVDIIQAVGRAIRKSAQKRHGVIILPVYIGSGEDDDTVLEDSSFKHVWRVLKALRSHDDQLASELDNLRTNLGKPGKVRASLPEKITFNLPTRVTARFADAFYLRTVRSITPLPPLTEGQILAWADAHKLRTGQWPKVKSGMLLGTDGEKWANIEAALDQGLRGLPGGSSLARLLAEKRNVRNKAKLPSLTIELVLRWAGAHHERTGEWPTRMSGAVLNSPGENWSAINIAMVKGHRGLPGGTSLVQLLERHRDLRNHANLPRLTHDLILQRADAHFRRTGEWPMSTSGPVADAPGETWANIHSALSLGLRGLSGGSTLAKLLAEHRGVRNIMDLPDLTTDLILQWVDAHHERTGEWPNQKSGAVTSAPGETWGNIHAALYVGRRGLPGGSTLAKLLAEHRGVRNIMDLPELTIDLILQWADRHCRRTGKWPNQKSGAVADAPGETWGNINNSLHRGQRGLPGGSSLARLFEEHFGIRKQTHRHKLTMDQIRSWMLCHKAATGHWPNRHSGQMMGAPDEKWVNLDTALRQGRRGLPGGSSLAKLLRPLRG